MSLADLLVELEAAKDPKKAGPMEAYMRQLFEKHAVLSKGHRFA